MLFSTGGTSGLQADQATQLDVMQNEVWYWPVEITIWFPGKDVAFMVVYISPKSNIHLCINGTFTHTRMHTLACMVFVVFGM